MTLWSPTFVAILNIYFALQNLTEALIAGWLAVFPLGCCRRWGEWPWSTILMQGECCLSEAKPWGWLSHWCQSAKGKRNKTKTSTTKMSVEPWVCWVCFGSIFVFQGNFIFLHIVSKTPMRAWDIWRELCKFLYLMHFYWYQVHAVGFWVVYFRE